MTEERGKFCWIVEVDGQDHYVWGDDFKIETNGLLYFSKGGRVIFAVAAWKWSYFSEATDEDLLKMFGKPHGSVRKAREDAEASNWR